MWRMGFKSSITVTNWRNWKKPGKKCKLYAVRNNCINTVRRTSSQVRVLREGPLVWGMTIWTWVNRVKLLSTWQTSRLEQIYKAVAHITYGVILPLYWAPAAVLRPCLGAAFEEKDEPIGASPEKSHRKEQNSWKHNPWRYTYNWDWLKNMGKKRQKMEWKKQCKWHCLVFKMVLWRNNNIFSCAHSGWDWLYHNKSQLRHYEKLPSNKESSTYTCFDRSLWALHPEQLLKASTWAPGERCRYGCSCLYRSIPALYFCDLLEQRASSHLCSIKLTPQEQDW